MSWLKAKISSNVNNKKGDTFKNSNVNISDISSSMLVEIYRSVGMLEGQVKLLLKDIHYIRNKFEDIDERLTKVELTTKELVRKGKFN